MKTYCFALDLQDDPALIAEYKRYHEPATSGRKSLKILGARELSAKKFICSARVC